MDNLIIGFRVEFKESGIRSVIGVVADKYLYLSPMGAVIHYYLIADKDGNCYRVPCSQVEKIIGKEAING